MVCWRGHHGECHACHDDHHVCMVHLLGCTEVACRTMRKGCVPGAMCIGRQLGAASMQQAGADWKLFIAYLRGPIQLVHAMCNIFPLRSLRATWPAGPHTGAWRACERTGHREPSQTGGDDNRGDRMSILCRYVTAVMRKWSYELADSQISPTENPLINRRKDEHAHVVAWWWLVLYSRRLFLVGLFDDCSYLELVFWC